MKIKNTGDNLKELPIAKARITEETKLVMFNSL